MPVWKSSKFPYEKDSTCGLYEFNKTQISNFKENGKHGKNKNVNSTFPIPGKFIWHIKGEKSQNRKSSQNHCNCKNFHNQIFLTLNKVHQPKIKLTDRRNFCTQSRKVRNFPKPLLRFSSHAFFPSNAKTILHVPKENTFSALHLRNREKNDSATLQN